MEDLSETIIGLSAEHAKRLGQLATERGMTQEQLVAEALDRLFRLDAMHNENSDDSDLLRRIEAEYGPSRARSVPPMDPSSFVINHVNPLNPELIRRPGV